jgi:hypothetical protein
MRIVVVAGVVGSVVACGEAPDLGVERALRSSITQPVTGAAFTTTNPLPAGPDDPGHCKNGNEAVNCNLYDGKTFVWLSGGPLAAALGDGTYFFAVLDPGTQQNPNDGSDGNLSDLPTGDTYQNRTFTMANGALGYDGTHSFANNKIRLMPYDDTSNPGGVYILAICRIVDDSYPVHPSDCKYDAFKVKPPRAPNELDVTIDGSLTSDKTFRWRIAKSVDQPENKQSSVDATLNYNVVIDHDDGTIGNWVLSGTVTVTNPTNAAITPSSVGIVVTPAAGDGTWTCDSVVPQSVPAKGSGSLPYECSYVPNEARPNPTAGLVTATATWVIDGGTHTVADANPLDVAGATVHLIDDCADVTDSFAGALGRVCVGGANPRTFTYSRAITGVPGTCTTFDNTATYTTIAVDPKTASASASARLCVGADLTVTKTALPSFTRTYAWDVSKAVDKTLVKQIGGTATFDYTVDARQTGFTDSGWMLTGVITVTNPNDWEVVTVDVVDGVLGGTCTVTGGLGVTIPEGGSVDLPYACMFALAPTETTNTATATWRADTAFTPNGSASGSADYAFVTPTTRVNQTITITDSFAGVLGTVTATDGAPYASATFTYTRTIPVPAWECLSYDNTATISETGKSASQSVVVCGPKKTGARTMGFWRNKNGQGIVKGQASIGTCPSTSWLRQYAPFEDLLATSSCTAVAAYVTNVIDAANAGGSAMNAMLKAQMLATALDVYFSDPALGGNKLGAPAPLGGVALDLTRVCTDLGTCTSFVNVGAAFGGATSLTVSQLLAYAASQSNVGGTWWYANVKSMQELAKDAFDAINNEKVFAP